MSVLAPALTREAAAARDEACPLRDRRRLFALPEGLVYLDGNSLGALPRVGAPRGSREVVSRRVGQGLICSWNTADWMDLAGRVATGSPR